jgi:hypothetical protein
MMRRRLSKLAVFGLALEIVLSLAAGLVVSFPAKAAGCGGPAVAFGRADFCGYFGNNFQNVGHDVLTGPAPGYNQDPSANGQNAVPVATVNSGPSFVNFIASRLNEDCNRVPVDPCRQDHVGAEFIILTMLGAPAGSPKSDATRRFGEWRKDVLGDAALGMVTWDATRLYSCSELNTLYQGPAPYPGYVGNGYDDVAPYKPQPTPSNDCDKTIHEIVFWSSPAKTRRVYEIKHDCANPIGEINKIPVPPYSLTATLSPGTDAPLFSTGPGTGIVTPGQTYHLTPDVKDQGVVDADPFWMEIENLTPAFSQNAGISSPGGQDTGRSFNPPGRCNSGVAQCWHWDYGNGLNAGSDSQQLNGAAFHIPANTPQGTQICYRLEVQPSNQNGDPLYYPSQNGRLCFLVYAPVYPSVVGQSGDVQAGGGLCGGTQYSGSITGNPNADSRSQYVTSASAAINDFGSNNATSGSGGDNLLLGRTPAHGFYAEVCRPDLYNQVAVPAISSGVGYCTAPAPPLELDLSSLPAACASVNVIVANGSVIVKESGGALHRRMTLVAKNNGNVDIKNDILVSGGSDRNNVPSLGIIADGDILIHAAATTVDAYLFADGLVDTCAEAATSASSCFTPTLNVNGFVMGHKLYFHRLGPHNAPAGSYKAENILLTAEIYLNPPPFFDDSVNSNSLGGEGERQPLF